MEVIVPLLFLAALAGIFFAAKRGAEAAQREREQRWSQLPRLAPAMGQQAASAPTGAGASPPGAANGSSAAAEATRGSSDAQPGPAAASTARARGAGAARSPQSSSVAAPAARSRAAPAARAAQSPGPATQGGSATLAPPSPRRTPAPIDLNTAPVAELQKLPGVGVRAAERIVAYRERHGPFSSVSGLEAVDGFDEHRVSRLAPRAKV